MRHRALRTTTVAAAAALALAACADGDDPQTLEEPGADDPAVDDELDLEDLDELDIEDLLGEGEDPLADMPDPNEDVEDGVFRGAGVALPVPEGWTLDPMSAAQGLIVALPEDGSQQFIGQAIDTTTLEEELTYDEVVESNRAAVPGVEPTTEEDVDLEGATQARQLLFEGATFDQQPDATNVLLLVAEDGEGRIAVFNYAAATEDYDPELAELLLASAGFDAGSEPVPPQPGPAG
ncbi:MAG: hypothetical protein JJT89_14345 [Nitriliruptoraceae bacterium]|nr:hypothetical protein [Nitriliruptoraceae bacterium]